MTTEIMPPPPLASTPAPAPLPPNDERTMALLAHLLPLAVGFWAPLAIWLIYKEKSAFVDDQGKESLNFQITLFIASLIGVAVAIMTCGVGIILLLPVVICAIVFCITGAVQATKGFRYRYPICFRFIK